jgi:hypothetical protein
MKEKSLWAHFKSLIPERAERENQRGSSRCEDARTERNVTFLE